MDTDECSNSSLNSVAGCGAAVADETSGNVSKQAATASPLNDDDDGELCPICLEAWTSSGQHRICSLRCGHFFGLACIERWLQTGKDCPNCNEKASRRDIRPHYVRRLKATDTADRDRAVKELDETRAQLRALELEFNSLKLTCQLNRQELDRLSEENRLLRSGILPVPECATAAGPVTMPSQLPGWSSLSSAGPSSVTYSRIVYHKRIELIRRESHLHDNQSDKYCRVMAYNELHGMLVVSRPSYTALSPGFGVKRINILDPRVDSFVGLHREAIRDLCFNPMHHDQLLSVSHDKTIRLTNISNCNKILEYLCDSEVWSCCYNLDNPHIFFVGTRLGKILMYDTRQSSNEAVMQLGFPVVETRPIVGLAYVPRCPSHTFFPCSGLVVATLRSLWFFEFTSDHEPWTYRVHRLPLDEFFWCLRFDAQTRLLLISTKPNPHSKHLVVELSCIRGNQDSGGGVADYQVTANAMPDVRLGGSYNQRTFLRACLCAKPGEDQSGQMMVMYGRGSANTDHKLVVQQLGNERILQEVPVGSPIMDVCAFRLNMEHFVAVLCETELLLYKWAVA